MSNLIVVRGPIGVGKSSVSSGLRDAMPDTASLVETDSIKRMIDPAHSSDWRRSIAHDTAGFIVERLLMVPRTAIVEAHTKYPEELERYREIAMKCGASLTSVLLIAPFEVCLARASSRNVQDISYEIDEQMLRDYYCNTDPQIGDLVFDTQKTSVAEIVSTVIAEIK